MAVITGEKCVVSYSADNSTYTPIPQVQSIEFSGFSVEAVETTDLDSNQKTYRASKTPDAGELSIELFYDPDTVIHTTIRGLSLSPAATTPYWRVTFTDATPATFTAQGIVTEFAVGSIENESNVTANVTVKLTGSVTIA